MRMSSLAAAAGLLVALSGLAAGSAPARTAGWLDWRGPNQNGTSPEKSLPDTVKLGTPTERWQVDFGGAGTPVIAGGKLYALGYRGQGPDLQEVLLCADVESGKTLWERRFTDYLSDIIYDRYAIGSPAVDPETGNVYVLTSTGLFSCFTPAGKLVWQHAMMEDFGRLTFPNGRTGAPFIEDDLVIARGITGNWGADGPAKDRFYAFDKRTGGLVWASGPGDRPKDNSFARPVFSWRNGKRVFYSGDGSGNVVCVNARTGEPIWRFPLSGGGINPSVLLYKDRVIAIHNDENLDTSEIGRMVAINVNAQPKPAADGSTPVLEPSAEVWRNDLHAPSSSPVLVGSRIYQMTHTGQLACVDADTGKVLWEHKLGPDQLHASPTYADGKLYIPLQNGSFFIIRPSDRGAEELCRVQLAGRCLGAPAVWNGRIYVLSTEKLYCFGSNGKSAGPAPAAAETPRPKPGKPVALQVVPAEVLLNPGEKATFVIRGIDENGFVTGTYPAARAKWAKYVPPTARVRAEMDGEFNARGELVAGSKNSAGAWEATIDGLKGYIRGRVLQNPPIREDFESYAISVDHATEPGVKFAYPPLPWIGARFKWEVREVDGSKVLAKTLDNIFFQRATVFFGASDMQNYTVEADVMTDGNRRTMSTVGLINQRYLITLDGNSQELEVSSNLERLRATAPFKWAPKQWYRLKTRVDVAPDGTGVVRAKAWKRGEPEPEQWTLEVPHKYAHTSGSPGLFGFAPQSLFRCYIDNISVTPN